MLRDRLICRHLIIWFRRGSSLIIRSLFQRVTLSHDHRIWSPCFTRTPFWTHHPETSLGSTRTYRSLTPRSTSNKLICSFFAQLQQLGHFFFRILILGKDGPHFILVSRFVKQSFGERLWVQRRLKLLQMFVAFLPLNVVWSAIVVLIICWGSSLAHPIFVLLYLWQHWSVFWSSRSSSESVWAPRPIRCTNVSKFRQLLFRVVTARSNQWIRCFFDKFDVVRGSWLPAALVWDHWLILRILKFKFTSVTHQFWFVIWWGFTVGWNTRHSFQFAEFNFGGRIFAQCFLEGQLDGSGFGQKEAFVV